MKKYYKTTHFRSKDQKIDIYFNWYTTKKGMLKFNVEVYGEINNGFCACIARYNTDENTFLNYIRNHTDYVLISDEMN